MKNKKCTIIFNVNHDQKKRRNGIHIFLHPFAIFQSMKRSCLRRDRRWAERTIFAFNERETKLPTRREKWRKEQNMMRGREWGGEEGERGRDRWRWSLIPGISKAGGEEELEEKEEAAKKWITPLQRQRQRPNTLMSPRSWWCHLAWHVYFVSSMHRIDRSKVPCYLSPCSFLVNASSQI